MHEDVCVHVHASAGDVLNPTREEFILLKCWKTQRKTYLMKMDRGKKLVKIFLKVDKLFLERRTKVEMSFSPPSHLLPTVLDSHPFLWTDALPSTSPGSPYLPNSSVAVLGRYGDIPSFLHQDGRCFQPHTKNDWPCSHSLGRGHLQ